MRLKPFDRCDAVPVEADVKRDGNRLIFTYRLSGDTADIVFPASTDAGRTHGLWQATCFEAFIAVGRTSYVELNFSPSGGWAAYRFDNYRQNMRELDMPAPRIAVDGDELIAEVQLPVEEGAGMNLAAVLQHANGTRTYWALAHPTSNRPDFHARDCFVGRLP